MPRATTGSCASDSCRVGPCRPPCLRISSVVLCIHGSVVFEMAVAVHVCTCPISDTSAVSHNSHVCCATQQKCLLCQSAVMSAMSCSAHVCCATRCLETQQTCLLCHTADMSGVLHSSRVCCVKRQARQVDVAADMSLVAHRTHVCCVTRKTCLLCEACGR